MAAVNFPQPDANNPATGDIYANGWFNEDNGVTYTYADNTWSAASTADLSQFFVDIDGDTMTGDLTVPSLNGGPLAGFRNQIINGDFRIWQRGTSLTLTNGSFYTADRWVVECAAGSTASNALTDMKVASDSLRVESPTNTGLLNIWQVIELTNPAGYDGRFNVSGSTWTFSFWAQSAVPSGVYADFRNTVTGGSPSGGTPLTVSSLKIIDTDSSWTRYEATITCDQSPVGYPGLGVAIQFPNGTKDVFVTGVQLEPGPVATPFEHRPIGTELALCQRYYQTCSMLRLAAENAAGSGNPGTGGIMFNTFMRAAPTVEDITYNNCSTRDLALNPNGLNVRVLGDANNSVMSVTDIAFAAEL